MIEIVQNGNTEQVNDNGIDGFEYTFGFKSLEFYKNVGFFERYQCLGPDGEVHIWNMDKEYRTNFLLRLYF